MSQKVTLSDRYMPKIKALLLEGKNQIEISQLLNLRRETVNRKIQRWIKTEDFETWIKEEFLRLHNKIIQLNPEEAYRQVTKLVSNMLTRKIEKKEWYMGLEKIEISWKKDGYNGK